MNFSGRKISAAITAVILILAASALMGGNCLRKQKPNLVLLIIDATRADHLSAYGYSRSTSPFLQELAEKGVIFLDAQAQASMTRISMPSLLTGMWPDKVLNFSEDEVLQDPAVTLAEILRDNGYQTACVQTNPWMNPRFGVSQGFDFYRTLYPENLADKQNKEVYRADRVISAAREWLAGRDRDKPYFLYLHFMDVHMPYLPPPPFNQLYVPPDFDYRLPDFTLVFRYLNGPQVVKTPPEVEAVFQTYDDQVLLQHMIDLYDGEIAYIDEQLRSLFAAIGDNTIAVIGSDHGEEFKDHGELLHGKTLHREVLHVPLIFHGPGIVPAGQTVKGLVRNVDILPTLIELAGLPVPANLDGRSLAPIWNGEEPAEVPPAFAHIYNSGAGTGRDYDWEFASLATPEWKFIKNLRTGELFLFSRIEDPTELNNLAPAEIKRVKAFRDQLARLMAECQKAKKRMGISDSQKSAIDPALREQLDALGYFNK